MEKFKGIQGKWKVGVVKLTNSKTKDLVIYPSKSVKSGNKNYNRAIASISPADKVDEIDLANAQLIAHAPEMLEMLQRIVDCMKIGLKFDSTGIERLIDKVTTPYDSKELNKDIFGLKSSNSTTKQPIMTEMELKNLKKQLKD